MTGSTLAAVRSIALPVQSAPFVALAADDSGHAMADVGYAWRGRVAIMGRIHRERASALAVTLAPSPTYS